MEKMIRYTENIYKSVPSRDAKDIDAPALAERLRTTHGSSCEILPKDINDNVRMFYDFDGEVANISTCEEFHAYTSYLNTLVSGVLLEL
jgi:hypothetical protein